MNAPFGKTGSRLTRVAVPVATPHKQRSSIYAGIFVGGLCAALVLAWYYRGSEFLTPKHGLGYWLGIAGASMMAAVLLYPLRKRIKFMRGLGILPTWFRWHMVFGLGGPVLVIIHSNFYARSTNALVALITMLVVAGSGVVGRYLYVRIHRGLYGAKLEANELLREAASAREMIGHEFVASSRWEGQLKQFESDSLVHSKTLLGAIIHDFRLGRVERRARKTILKEYDTRLREEAKRLHWSNAERRGHYKSGRIRIERYFASVRKVSALAIYERLFALWHVLHLPLIVLLIATALIHIAAVNLY